MPKNARESVQDFGMRSFNEPPEGFVIVILVGLLAVAGLLVWLALVTVGQVAEFLLAQRKKSEPPPEHPVCPTCGYDLRASRFRCPECGTPIRLTPPVWPRVVVYRGFVITSSRRGRDE